MMNIIFGDNKVAIHGGLTNDNKVGVVEFHQLIKPNIDDKSNYIHKDVQFSFKNIESIDTVIDMLRHIQRNLYMEQIKSEIKGNKDE